MLEEMPSFSPPKQIPPLGQHITVPRVSSIDWWTCIPRQKSALKERRSSWSTPIVVIWSRSEAGVEAAALASSVADMLGPIVVMGVRQRSAADRHSDVNEGCEQRSDCNALYSVCASSMVGVVPDCNGLMVASVSGSCSAAIVMVARSYLVGVDRSRWFNIEVDSTREAILQNARSRRLSHYR